MIIKPKSGLYFNLWIRYFLRYIKNFVHIHNSDYLCIVKRFLVKYLRNKYIQWILIAIYAICTVIILFPPDILLFKKVSNYAVHWMMFCLFSGIVFLIFGLCRYHFIRGTYSRLVGFVEWFKEDIPLSFDLCNVRF